MTFNASIIVFLKTQVFLDVSLCYWVCSFQCFQVFLYQVLQGQALKDEFATVVWNVGNRMPSDMLAKPRTLGFSLTPM